MSSGKSSQDLGHDELLLIKPAKWSLVVVVHLKNGTLRFGELRRRIGGISQKILSETLRDLERDGFITRTHYATIPPRVEYQLTEMGGELLAFANAWKQFVMLHQDSVTRARIAYDKKNEGHPPIFEIRKS